MDFSQLDGYGEAIRIVESNVSPRYRQLSNLDAWIHGRQYDGLPSWFSIDRPLWERAPCIVYLLAKESVDSKVDIVLGEGRFPTFTTSPGEDDEAFDDELGLNHDDSEILDRFTECVIDQSRFCVVAREVLHHAQDVGSAVAIFGARNGKLFADTTKAQWCEPTLDADGCVLSLEIRYPYLDPYKDQQGKWRVRVKIYRRVIDDKTDTTYKPADADKNGAEPAWRADPSLTFEHGLGFCPVVWYPFMRGCSTANQIDGQAVHSLFLDEIRGLDFALSQQHRAALFAGDPQWTECGVEPGFNPSGAARTALLQPTGGKGADGKPAMGKWVDVSGGGSPARLKSPGSVWQYPNPETKVQLHTLPGDALKALFDHATDLRMKLCQMLAHVPLDPESIRYAATVSGKALDALRKRELNRCDQIRDDITDRFLIPSVQMMLRICAILGAGGGLRVPGINKALPILQRFIADDISINVIWPAYSEPEPAEEQQIIATVVAAHNAGLITDRMAMEKIKPIFGIGNIDQALDALQDEKAQRQKNAMTTAAAMAEPDDDDKEGEDDSKDSRSESMAGGLPG